MNKNKAGGGRKKIAGYPKVDRIARVLANALGEFPTNDEHLHISINTLMSLRKQMQCFRKQNSAKLIQKIRRKDHFGIREIVRGIYREVRLGSVGDANTVIKEANT